MRGFPPSKSRHVLEKKEIFCIGLLLSSELRFYKINYEDIQSELQSCWGNAPVKVEELKYLRVLFMSKAKDGV